MKVAVSAQHVWTAVVGFLLSTLALEYGVAREPLDFRRDVRPILSDKCFRCHGPDASQRRAGLRLDTQEGALEDLGDGRFAVVAGDAHRSLLVERIFSEDPEERMPPPGSTLSLAPREKALLKRWVEEGAAWQAHWAFLPPEKPTVPHAEHHGGHEPIDRFISRLWGRQGLTPTPAADRERLLRRVTLDLTGLPPTPDEIDAFLRDRSPDAYERVVDRLLQTVAYAERVALEWLDVARYADSHGLHADGWRFMWPWRDWVIQAFGANMSYDRFVSWQLAGDLMPDAGREQILATAFHRNHAMTAEGGVVDEEFRLNYVFDRAQTTATAFLGLTLQCARCHDHKFDPISQKEYYQLTAFFNNVKELGMTGDDGNFGPMLMLPDEETERKLALLDDKIVAMTRARQRVRVKVAQSVRASEIQRRVAVDSAPEPDAYFPLEAITDVELEQGEKARRVDGNAKALVAGSPEVVAGKVAGAFRFKNEYDTLSLEDVGLFDLTEEYTVAVWIRPETRGKAQSLLGNAGHKNTFWRGWDFYLDPDNHLALKLIHSLPHNYVEVRSGVPLPVDEWSHVAFTYDGSGEAVGVALFVDGRAAATTVAFDRLYKSIAPVSNTADRTPEKRPVRVGKAYRRFGGDFGIFKGTVDDIRLYERALTEVEMTRLFQDFQVSSTPLRGEALRAEALLEHYLARHHAGHRKLMDRLADLRRQRLALAGGVPEVMVLEEMSTPRPTHLLERGDYKSPQDRVAPATPPSILAFPEELPRNRLGLARWLFDARNPLTARVAVNRYWQMLFGTGLVETSEDFGSQGTPPTHPELLDWLAVSFVESGWDLKRLLRTLVTSQTYRRDSMVTSPSRERDPSNRFLARGPSYRLSAEVIRDGALAASGLLARRVGGPSVKPYQPEGLWVEKTSFSPTLLKYIPDQGEKLYRRSLYTFIRRTSPPPAMIAFDAPNREICILRRERTNTPQQALVLLNDPQIVEAARVLALRVQQEVGPRLDQRVVRIFRLVTGRRPKPAEQELLVELYQEELARFRDEPESVKKFLRVGEYRQGEAEETAETAALAFVAHTMLNHDGFYMKR